MTTNVPTTRMIASFSVPVDLMDDINRQYLLDG